MPLTNTLNVPRVANGVMSWMIARYPEIGITDDTLTPVVAECDDGRLNDIQGRHVSELDVIQALDGASSGVVQEGTVGAGTGMVSYGFKGGHWISPKNCHLQQKFILLLAKNHLDLESCS